jgi:uncharacterized protein YkwD
MPTRPRHAVAFLLGFWLGLALFLPLAAPAAFDAEGRAEARARARAAKPADAELAALEHALHVGVNDYRKEHNLVALVRRDSLDTVARAHSADMAARRYLSHETPEGVNWVGRLARGGVEGFTMAGENVGLTSRPSPNDEILQGWIRSPVHRENLVGRAYNATGLGIARAADGTLYYTQLYLSFPRDAR